MAKLSREVELLDQHTVKGAERLRADEVVPNLDKANAFGESRPGLSWSVAVVPVVRARRRCCLPCNFRSELSVDKET